MKNRFLACAALLFLAISPAHADTRAVYKASKFGGEMVIEIAANGNVRGTMGGRGDYFLTIDGESYIVFATSEGVVVDRVSDVAAALGDYVRKNMPEFRDAPDFDEPAMFAGGMLTVRGRPGTAWYTKRHDHRSPDPEAVISADPELGELGIAMARQFEISMVLMKSVLGRENSMMNGTLKVLRTGAPLQFSGMELDTVDHAPIAPERFVLPAAPETLDQVRARLEKSGGHIP